MRVMGIHAIRKTVEEMLKSAELDGFFSDHSLRCSSTTRLFNAGVDRKLIKEFMGHSSDVVDLYQITSHDQRAAMSKIIEGKKTSYECEVSVESGVSTGNCLEIEVCNKGKMNQLGCSCTCQNVNLKDTRGIGQLVNDMLDGKKFATAKIKLEIEISE